MAKTVTCLFGSDSQASAITRELEQSGISQGKICMFTNSGNNRLWNDTGSFDESSGGSHHDRVEHYLVTNGVPRDDARAYAEGVRRGHALIAVRCDDDEADRVVDILDNDDVLDLDERQDAWRSEGWTDYGSGVSDLDRGSATTSAGMMGGADLAGDRAMQDRDSLYGDRLSGRDRSSGDDEVIPVAEEELHVGKREVSHGRVRIRSHVIERPVQEQVTLSEERVAVERRPVDGSTRAGSINDGDLFRERTVEMEERAEEPVISKDARIVEEVVVRKEADQRTETVSDTVQKTEVEVEDERGNAISRTGTTDTDR